jgi:hypothetical protein
MLLRHGFLDTRTIHAGWASSSAIKGVMPTTQTRDLTLYSLLLFEAEAAGRNAYYQSVLIAILPENTKVK